MHLGSAVRGSVLSIKEWPIADRPRERLLRLGAGALSTVELLTIIVGTGNRAFPADEIARRLIAAFPGLRQLAGRAAADLLVLEGIGEATAARLAAALELGRRLQKERRERQPTLSTPRAVWRHLALELRDRERERFLALCLNTRNELIREVVVSVGSLNASIVHPREVFKPALACAAAGLVIAHNHPSGDPAPSRDDIELTRRLVHAGEIMGIDVIDHVILADTRYFSFREAGRL